MVLLLCVIENMILFPLYNENHSITLIVQYE